MCLQNWKHSNDVDAWQGGRLSDLGSGSPRRTTFKGNFLKSLDIKQTLCQVTGCQEFPKGNFLSWENTNWFLNSSRGTVNIQPSRMISCYNWQFYNSSLIKFFFTWQARKEVLDLETEICRRSPVSFHVVPYKLKVGNGLIPWFLTDFRF